MDAPNILTQTEAIERAEQVKQIGYEIHLDLKAGSSTYQGETKISFFYTGKGKGKLKIDFVTKKIEVFLLNGKDFSDYTKTDSFLDLPVNFLNVGMNEIKILYTNDYNHSGSGFHQFQDPSDGSEYLHTDFEPFEAHRMFPCFDQPDLKATYELSLIGPKDWKYVHNTLPIKEKIQKERIEIRFQKTALFSTYLFALISGPYEVWEDRYKNIPLRILCRKSLSKYMDAENIFAITKESFGFLESYFDLPYPYGKYDQIFVPEFNMGAMENVGAVTFSEHYIFRSPRIYSEYLGRANTIYHEMVHMWFGNLVTMKWWNDLWLNESFADYLSYYAMSHGKLFPDALEHFYVREEWAYREDQLSTTHPIAGSAENTLDAISNFDGISYSKGASVLRQLMYYIGEDSFRNAMRKYFQKFKNSNTIQNDFLDTMSETSGIDIRNWSKEWLDTTGVNTLLPVWKENRLFIRQLPSDTNGLLRTHALEVTVFALKEDKIEKKYEHLYDGHIFSSFKAVWKDKVVVQGEETILPYSPIVKTDSSVSQNAKTKNSPILQTTSDPKNSFLSEIVVLNTNDHAYAKTYLPKDGIPLLKTSFNKLKDRFAKRILWGSLWQMTRDAEISPKDFLDLVLLQGIYEEDLSVRNSHILTKASSIVTSYLKKENREEWSKKLNDLSKKFLSDPSIQEEEKIVWYRMLEGTSRTADQLSYLKDLLDGKIIIPGIKIDQERRWSILTRLSAFGEKNALVLIANEEKLDTSDLGAKKAYTAKVAFPDPKSKAAAWKEFTDPNTKYSTDMLRYGMRGFYWDHQEEILKIYEDLYFQSVIGIYKDRDSHFSSAFGNILFPGLEPNQSLVDKTNRFLKEQKEIPALLKKDLKQHRDDLIRTVKILSKQ
ncbi:Peptidase family M1 [Leptospira interrogans serovar Manilae]|uniref:Aminopeptidase N n=2 Tax=Leptospira interrogans TaxID=173 RepID=A0AAQ1P4U4_LEPIR|nr:M1 family aminopeptidase [Leptospira interrogans]AKP26756.1 aminopeptidase N [Leptospira interrogans serovar Manilae]AKP30534.1 aminopeptidase N [Leptospira interrogans serovar Manilae]EYU64212.1 aminopeptidase N [Leptospira interrogans serovar Manilae]SOR63681.1 Peptidase family M1 [Leptospira interrogans serovar Manilae]